MKKTFSLFLAFVISLSCVTSGAFAAVDAAEEIARGTCGEGLVWTLDSAGELLISGTGEMENYDGDTYTAPWYDYRTDITRVTVENGVSDIGDFSFFGFTAITDVDLPVSITRIGVSAFQSCTSLASVNVPASVTMIGSSSFYGCTALTSVIIPASMSRIGNSAFAACTDLVSATVYSSYIMFGFSVFSETAEGFTVYGIPESPTETYANTNEHKFIAVELPSYDLQFSEASLTLQNNLAINYKVDKATFDEAGYTEPYAVFVLNGVTTTLTEYTEQDGKYVFRFSNISPKYIGDTVYSTLYAKYNGVEFASPTVEYGVSVYCYSMLDQYAEGEEYAKLRTLLVDLLNYGAKSQIYTSHNTDELANFGLMDDQLAWSTGDIELNDVLDTAYKTVAEPEASWKGAGLVLDDAVTVRLKLVAHTVDGLHVRIKLDNGTEWIIDSSEFVVADGVYYVYFEGLHAGQMSENLYLTVMRGDTEVSNTARYSVESYAYYMQNSSDTALAELVVAMMKYGKAATAYAD